MSTLQSLRKAAIGSKRAAFRAGNTPANSPTVKDRPKPADIDQTETTNGNLNAVAADRAIAIPNPIPAVPPTVDTKVPDS
jgi:hypothetical protein